MHEGIYIAASAGLKQGRKMEVIAQNLANVNNTGYKRDRLVFKEMMPSFKQETGLDGANKVLASPEKSNSNVSYVAITDHYTDFTPGAFKETGGALDIALDGQGFFSVQTEEGVRYTRNGNFRLDTANRLVNQKGQPILNEENQPIVIDAKGADIGIDQNGNISVGTGLVNISLGNIKLVDFNMGAIELFIEFDDSEVKLHEIDNFVSEVFENSLIEKLKTTITKLKEYRTAIITAAVTGKIDVRNH